jgi:hypothetical protein
VKSGNYTIAHVRYLVIKTAAYFPLQCARNSGEVLAAVRGSLDQHGVEIQAQSWDSDAVIIWSVLWHGRMLENREVYDHYRGLDRPVIVIDVGTLIRGVTWKVAVNNITADGHYGHEHNLDWDRPRLLGITLENRTLRPEILIAAQHQQSLQMSGVPDQEAWITQQIAQIRSTTDRPIVVRSHPRCALNIGRLPSGIEIQAPQRLANTYDSYDMNVNYHAVVNHNSGPGIQAALAGARPIVDRSSLAAPVGVDIGCIEQSYAVDRERWLVEIAHTEYTIPELEAGLWIQRLEPYL